MFDTAVKETEIMSNVIPMNREETIAPLADQTPKVNLEYSGKPLQLTQGSLVMMWDAGLLTAKPYAILAMMLDRVGAYEMEDFDIEDFISRWEGPENDKGKCKQLKPNDVVAALKQIESVTSSKVELVTRVQLNMDF